jgi:protein-tyrosine phosphatase
MFGFLKSKKAVNHYDLSFLRTDMHSHLIPGIDDGSESVEDSIALIRGLTNLGISKIVTTPHVFHDFYPNTRKNIDDGLELLRFNLVKEGINMSIRAAAEYYIDEYFEMQLATGDLLPIRANEVLVEVSFLGAPLNLHNILFGMQTRGYVPILAHPERYRFYKNDIHQFLNLKKLGCKFQINLNSLGGYYGIGAKETAKLLLKEKLVDYAGTDLHNLKHIVALQKLLGMAEEMELLTNYEHWANWDI